MANNSALITSTNPADGGELHRAALGTTVPTDAITELAEAFKGQGYTGPEGFVVSVTRETTDKKAYGGKTVYTTQDDYGVSVKVTLMESANGEVLKTVFGDANVDVAGANTTVRYNANRLPRSVWTGDHVTDQGLRRQVIPIGQVTAVDDFTLVHSDVLAYSITITAYPDADGNYMYEYITTDEAEDDEG